MAKASYEIRGPTDDGKFYYVQVGANNEDMNRSTEMYRDRTDAERGAKDARKAARFAKIVDTTTEFIKD